MIFIATFAESFVMKAEIAIINSNVLEGLGLKHIIELLLPVAVVSNYETLQDVFADLLIKGFVPYSCLDVVISRINKVKKCTYMRPLLVAYKFGGLHDDKG